MKVYLCSVGESTEQVCKKQLERFGFEVVLLAEKESWIDKYNRFLNLANDDCIRIDADIIPNENIKKVELDCDIVQCLTYDFYRNNIFPSNPVFYSKNTIEKLKGQNFNDKDRPETCAWRDFGLRVKTSDLIVGLHGFFQNKETMKRAIENKEKRKQEYDLILRNL